MSEADARPADSSDMRLVHRMFRTEFADLPGLVRGVPDGDDRAVTVADHAVLMSELLHSHHSAEDDVLYPRLLERAGEKQIVDTMEAEHAVIADLIATLDAAAGTFRASRSAADRDEMAEAATRLIEPLDKHLSDEEEQVLSLIDAYLTQAEWAEVGARGLTTVPPERVPVLFGMLVQYATGDELDLVAESVPPPVFAQMLEAGPVALKEYRAQLRGEA